MPTFAELLKSFRVRLSLTQQLANDVPVHRNTVSDWERGQYLPTRVIGMIVAIVLRLSNVHALEGQTTTLVTVLFLGGVQLIFLGVLGEYLGRIYDEVKRRPLYIVAEELGFEEAEPKR